MVNGRRRFDFEWPLPHPFSASMAVDPGGRPLSLPRKEWQPVSMTVMAVVLGRGLVEQVLFSSQLLLYAQLTRTACQCHRL